MFKSVENWHVDASVVPSSTCFYDHSSLLCHKVDKSVTCPERCRKLKVPPLLSHKSSSRFHRSPRFPPPNAPWKGQAFESFSWERKGQEIRRSNFMSDTSALFKYLWSEDQSIGSTFTCQLAVVAYYCIIPRLVSAWW